jgi:hypothetical protein
MSKKFHHNQDIPALSSQTEFFIIILKFNIHRADKEKERATEQNSTKAPKDDTKTRTFALSSIFTARFSSQQSQTTLSRAAQNINFS